MNIEDKVKILEDKDFNWLEISDLLDISYEEVRAISGELDFKQSKVKP